MQKLPKQEYAAEFKEQAVEHAQAVGIVVGAKELGLVEQALHNWVKASVTASFSVIMRLLQGPSFFGDHAPSAEARIKIHRTGAPARGALFFIATTIRGTVVRLSCPTKEHPR